MTIYRLINKASSYLILDDNTVLPVGGDLRVENITEHIRGLESKGLITIETLDTDKSEPKSSDDSDKESE